MEAYCMKCKTKVTMNKPVETKTSRGTKMTRGKCSKCGTSVCKFG